MSTLADIMTTGIKTVRRGTSITDAAQLMQSDRISSLLIEKNGEMIGIITDTDIVRKGVAEKLDQTKVAVGKIMTAPLDTIESTRSLRDAHDMMADLSVPHLPVSQSGKVV